MSSFPDPLQIVESTGLPESSHLQRVLRSERERLLHWVPPVVEPPPPPAPGFEEALRREASLGGAVIAEFKQGSPSLGPFAQGTPLLRQLEHYRQGGASAFSILVEPSFFLGSTADLRAAASLGIPCLYKGFVISEAQLLEAKACGASAVLLIARVLREHTAPFAREAAALGLEALVELHDLTELPLAQAAGARLVGINARDLATFTLGSPGAEALREAFPEAVLIRESGLATPEDALASFEAGFDAVLIGEALMRSADPAGFLGRIRAGRPVRT
ncbi:MAG: indole-3-glycerol-phosphate synthase [Acidobacteria bacterium]|nr:indole-3-glycerol-phosphate synthase [Acidobacteriota bacterium]